MRFLVTGANGFVGRACVEALERLPASEVVGSVRSPTSLPHRVRVGDLGPDTDWSAALAGVDVVVHTAARVHIREKGPAADAAQIAANALGSARLAGQAAAAGVKRFVFISSILVNGRETAPGRPFVSGDDPNPQGPHAMSKAAAEAHLRALSAETGMELVIVRPPMVYGRGVPASFAAMVRWVRSGVPLPLGLVDNRRSMVSIDNLADLIVAAATHPAAPGHVFLAADGKDLSTTQWLKAIGRAIGRRPRLLPVPAGLLRLGANALGAGETAGNLLGSLQVDIEATKRTLGWMPPLTVEQGLDRL